MATRRVIANLFYRDLTLTRPVHLGETLHTVTEVRALSDASRRPGTPARGKVLLGITTTADDDVVLAFEDEFDIEIADEDVDTVNTIGDCVSLISQKI